MINPKRIMRGPHGPRKTSTDDPTAIIGTQGRKAMHMSPPYNMHSWAQKTQWMQKMMIITTFIY